MIDDDSAVAGGGEPATSASPRTPYSERPVARDRRVKAHKLIERLVAEGRVRITVPDDDEVAEWRRVINYAKRHGLEPAGKRIEKVPYGGPGLELLLADGPHLNARSQRPREGGDPVPVPSRLGNLRPIVTALKDDESRLVLLPARGRSGRRCRRLRVYRQRQTGVPGVHRSGAFRAGASHTSRRARPSSTATPRAARSSAPRPAPTPFSSTSTPKAATFPSGLPCWCYPDRRVRWVSSPASWRPGVS